MTYCCGLCEEPLDPSLVVAHFETSHGATDIEGVDVVATGEEAGVCYPIPPGAPIREV